MVTKECAIPSEDPDSTTKNYVDPVFTVITLAPFQMNDAINTLLMTVEYSLTHTQHGFFSTTLSLDDPSYIGPWMRLKIDSVCVNL